MKFKITHKCENLCDIDLNGGVVAGVYNNCFNILTSQNELVTIFKRTDKFSTRAMIADTFRPMCELPIRDGMKAVKCHERIILGELVFDMSNSSAIPTRRKPMEATADLDRGMKIFKSCLSRYGRSSPIFADGYLREKAQKGFSMLKTGPQDGFPMLVGLGVGLTPSCDDILSGMAAYMYLSGTGQSFNEQLALYLEQQGDSVTTMVSKNLLLDVAKGCINQCIYDLVYAIMNDEQSIEKQTIRLIDYGSTSGTETCAGILAGHELCKGKETIEWL